MLLRLGSLASSSPRLPSSPPPLRCGVSPASHRCGQRVTSWYRLSASITTSKRRRLSAAPSRRTDARLDVEQPVDLGVARPALGVPRTAADLDLVGTARALRRERHARQILAVVADDDHWPVLAQRRVLLERHPRPDHLARIGVAVSLRVGTRSAPRGWRRAPAAPCDESSGRCCARRGGPSSGRGERRRGTGPRSGASGHVRHVAPARDER